MTICTTRSDIKVRVLTNGRQSGLMITPTPDPFVFACPLIYTWWASEVYEDSPKVDVSDKKVKRMLCSLMVLVIVAIFAGAAMFLTLR